MKKPNSTAQAILFSLLIVVAVSFLAATVKAGPPKPSKADLQNLEDIKENQRGIAQREEWNKAEIAELNKNGWNVQWNADPDSLVLVPLESAL